MQFACAVHAGTEGAVSPARTSVRTLAGGQRLRLQV